MTNLTPNQQVLMDRAAAQLNEPGAKVEGSNITQRDAALFAMNVRFAAQMRTDGEGGVELAEPSVLAHQRAVDAVLCRKIRLISDQCSHLGNWEDLGHPALEAATRIEQLNADLAEACHERDGLLARLEMGA